MKTIDAIHYFKTRAAIAAALSIKPSAVSQWGEYPPRLRQLEIERLTRGALVAEPTPLSVAA